MDIQAAQLAGHLQVKDEIGVRCQKLFQDFLEEFEEDDALKYRPLVKELGNPERSTLEVNFQDVEKYNQQLATTIIEEYFRVFPFLCQAVGNFARDNTEMKTPKDCYVSFTDVPTRHKVRELVCAKIGTLIRISGQVVRTHPVHPELVSGTFTCLDCQTEISGIEQQFKFTNPTICRNPVCANRRRFMLDVGKSTFVDFQKVRIQETQFELPRGCIPRSVEVILHAEAVECVQAGDRYDFTGSLIVVPDVSVLSSPGQRAESKSRHKGGDNDAEGVRGLQALGVRELKYRTAFLACSVQATNTRFGGNLDAMMMEDMTAEMMKENMTDAEWNKVYEMSRDRNLYANLTSSLFPTIHGCDEVKRGLVLLLFGGVAKTTQEGTTLRGDLNCCIVGDPSTAKSQLLKQVADFSPRAIYTSGKASTAAGLTAAVVKDEESFEFVIEAGALMLADNGVCCIDEFDKMDPKDQVAIHEAMEQQTISIAKAGVRATLNARTSILAAANPIGGRYDRAKSLQQNIALTAPIMSRFDLFFILVDECNEVVDYSIARKIVDLHSGAESTLERVYSLEEILRYMTFARQFKPVITEEAAALLVENYTHLRQRDGTGNGKATWRVTVRQLESMIRLSEAQAKMQCSDEVLVKHVKEAYRLLNKSIIRVEQPDIDFEEEFDDPTAMEVDEPAPNGTNGVANGVANGDANGDENGHTNGHVNGKTNGHVRGEDGEEEPAADPLYKKKLKLTFEQYKTMSNMLVFHMREVELRGTEQGREEEGIKRSDVVTWYLEQVAEELESEADLLERKGLIEKVIDRLVNHDQVVIALTSAGLKSLGEGESMQEEDPMLVVHPNYNPE